MFNDDAQTPAQDELTALKTRAQMLGLAFHPSIGLDKLREKVNAAAVGPAKSPDDQPEVAAPVVVTPGQLRLQAKQDALRLIRIRITCMNPAKKEWEGEILTVGNSVIGSVKKYVPFNADEGWHVPYIMYEQLRDRQCQVFYSVKDDRGNTIRKGKLIREFAIEILPPLTPAELADLAQRQAISKSID